MRLAKALTLAVLASGQLGCARPSHGFIRMTGGDPQRGKVLIGLKGCGACHEITGIPTAHGLVGPPLRHLARRTVLAGVLANTPDNLIRWIQTPQSVVPGNAMPNASLSEQQARDIAAYLTSET